ncbi:hypothetical protein, partial [Algoriphagus sp.]|uniref:hypothetical protein n=1 Tax=Algoriphagus sp. TaxID=1872435 RepID=UPI00257FE104
PWVLTHGSWYTDPFPSAGPISPFRNDDLMPARRREKYIRNKGNTPSAKYLSRRDLSLVEKGYKDSYPCCRYGR